MKAVKLTDIKKLEVFDVPEPGSPGPHDVLIKVNAVGICGSDIHYFNKGRIGSQIISFPFTLGHEMSGTVEKTGTEVENLKRGMRIIVDPLVACFKCSQCRQGRYHTCRNQKFLGCPGQIEGCLSEYIVMPESCCYQIPESVSYEAGVICEPLAIGIYAVKLSGLMNGQTAGILGSGPIGLSVMLACRSINSGSIYMTDKLDYRCSFAKNNGADRSGNPVKEDIVKVITGREPELLDVIFECCGQQDALDQAMDLVKPGGKIMIIGIPEFDRYSFAVDKARRNEISIHHVRRQNECTQQTIDTLLSNRINPDFMATHSFSYKKAQKAFELVAGYNDNVIKAVIRF